MYSQILLTAGKLSVSAIHCLTGDSLCSCCVDEVAAQHVDADAVVHYGHACMSMWVPLISPFMSSDLRCYRNYRLPVIYVFGKKPVDVTNVAQKLRESYVSSNIPAKSVVFRHDVAYTHEAGEHTKPKS